MESVTINVSDQSGPLLGVLVQVYGAGGGIISGGSSPLSASLPPGSWSVELVGDKMTAVNPYSISVIDTDGVMPQTFGLTVTTLAITDPGRPRVVKVFGYLVGGDSRPVSARIVVRTVGMGQRRPYVTPPGSPSPAIDPQVTAVLPEALEARSNAATGYWEADVAAGALVRVEVGELRYVKTFRVPDDGTAALDVCDARPDPGPQGLDEYLSTLADQVGP